MRKLIAATVAALALAPAVAAAAPTASQIATPANPTFATVDPELPQSLQITGATSGGDGDVDIRCYWGSTSAKIAGPVAVNGGAFDTSVALDQALLLTIGYPHPFCTLRAVPTGTSPAAAPGSPSAWAGPSVGWGRHDLYRVGAGFDPTPPETVWDYGLSMAQPKALNYLDSATSCGLCDTFLFAPGTKAISNSIWYVNGGIFRVPYGVTDRTGVIIDGLPAYGPATAHFNPDNLSDNSGLPSISVGTSVDPATGDLVVDERSEFKHCAPQPATFPATSASCTSFTDTGVVLERRVRVTDEGLLVTFTDHWKSVDSQTHELDAMYEDSEHSENGATVGHEGRVNFTWTQDGFKSYGPDQKIALPEQAPVTMLVKTDATTPDAGDNMNPFGAVIYGTRPTDLTVSSVGRVGDGNGRWHPRYVRTLPAVGDVEILFAYTHDFTLDAVKARAQKAKDLLVPPVGETPTPPPPAGSSSDPAPAPVPQSTPAIAQPKPVMCVVPKLRGKTLARAKLLLKRAHCALGKVSRRAGGRVKPGRVLATRLKPGTRVRAGTRIRVTVARKL
jgi:hypothetical protein